MSNSVALQVKKKRFKLPDPPKISNFQLIFLLLGIWEGFEVDAVDTNTDISMQLINLFNSNIVEFSFVFVLFVGLALLQYKISADSAKVLYEQVQLNSMIDIFLIGLGVAIGMAITKQEVQNIYILGVLIKYFLLFTIPRYLVHKFYSQSKDD
jgi:uncharacterized paraquat-inducible protein A